MLSRPLRYALLVTVMLTALAAWRDWQGERAENDGQDERVGHSAAQIDARPPAEAQDAASGPAPAPAAEIVTAPAPADGTDLFPMQTWAPPPPVNPPPRKRHAPPLPFSLVGLWNQGQTRHAVVSAAGRQYVLCNACETSDKIEPGALIMPDYRFDAIDDQTLVFTYLPLNERQTLSTGNLK